MGDFFGGIGGYVVPFLIVLTVLVFVHEYGHYAVARLNKVRVEVFSIGFGPEIFGWTDRAGTRWKISAIPLGGYVKMYGDRDGSSAPDVESVRDMTPEQRAVSFYYKSLSQRSAIVAAGPIANFLFAILAFAAIYGFVGQPFTAPEIASVNEGSAAERAGLQAGDRILEIDGRTIQRFEEVQLIVQTGLGEPLSLLYSRDGETKTAQVIPDVVAYTDRFGNTSQIGRLGVQSTKIEFIRHNPIDAVWQAVISTYNFTAITLKAVGQFLTGTRSTKELSGPIGIAKMSGDMAQGGVVTIIWFMAVLSINLGLINLFPVPVLDGGHLLFYAYEAVRGRPLGERAQEFGFRLGLGLVLLLMLFVTWNDLVNIVGRLIV